MQEVEVYSNVMSL